MRLSRYFKLGVAFALVWLLGSAVFTLRYETWYRANDPGWWRATSPREQDHLTIADAERILSENQERDEWRSSHSPRRVAAIVSRVGLGLLVAYVLIGVVLAVRRPNAIVELAADIRRASLPAYLLWGGVAAALLPLLAWGYLQYYSDWRVTVHPLFNAEGAVQDQNPWGLYRGSYYGRDRLLIGRKTIDDLREEWWQTRMAELDDWESAYPPMEVVRARFVNAGYALLSIYGLGLFILLLRRPGASTSGDRTEQRPTQANRGFLRSRPHFFPFIIVAGLCAYAGAVEWRDEWFFQQWMGGRDFYTLLGVVVMAASGYAALLAWRTREDWAIVLFGATALVFCPIVPTDFGRETWRVLDFAACLVFLIGAVSIKKV